MESNRLRPNSPITESDISHKNDFLPPVPSTEAPNGIRNNDPDSVGMATNSPIIDGVMCITSLSLVAEGPNSDIAADPKKNPRVAAAKPRVGEPLMIALVINDIFIIFLSVDIRKARQQRIRDEDFSGTFPFKQLFYPALLQFDCLFDIG
ncbi:hypothetical protein SDC9_197397 [bioreactor metagenome]|uniref:Uncharacterized protein n=1 Tax=bioreactor metagenome TaxID=1076179 RepID=A0A645IER6_9ZZZZ